MAFVVLAQKKVSKPLCKCFKVRICVCECLQNYSELTQPWEHQAETGDKDLANNVCRQRGRMLTHTPTQRHAHTHLFFFNSFLSLPAIMEVTVRLILHRSQDLIVSVKLTVNKRKRSEGTMCQSVQLKLPVEVAVVGGERNKYLPFLLSFKPTLSFFFFFLFSPNTRQTGPLPYQPRLSQHCPDFPLQLLIKLFRAATRGRVFKELRSPPHVVWGVLSRHRPPEWSLKNKAT